MLINLNIIFYLTAYTKQETNKIYYPSSSIVLRLLFSSLSNDSSFLNRSTSISVGILIKLFLDFRELERLEFEEPVEINIELEF